MGGITCRYPRRASVVEQLVLTDLVEDDSGQEEDLEDVDRLPQNTHEPI